ncbi:MAG: phage tail protein [Pseudomonadota bacterium]
MATLVLSAVGSAVAGPFGSAVGGLIGRQVDQRLFGSGATEGPRLTELAVTTSSYGQAIPRRFGQMRVAGTIIWATNLVESSETEGGKGQPSRTTYSYSVSMAVAVSSTPISKIGRVWADGELLVGSTGDMKVGGVFRTYLGYGDDLADPLIEAEQNEGVSAFRDFAYVVFEDLQLEEFGNRIPALTFEVFTPSYEDVSLLDILPANKAEKSHVALHHARGFSDEGGQLSSSLNAIDQIYPLTAVSGVEGVSLFVRDALPDRIFPLNERLSSSDISEATERYKRRRATPSREPLALRYYDESLDYQPGVQRAFGRRMGGSEVMIDLPVSMKAEGAKELVNAKAHHSRWHQEENTWITAELNPEIMPGASVSLPDVTATWRVVSWEWRESGVEYGLQRMSPVLGQSVGADSGSANTARDMAVTPTILTAIEVPPSGIMNASRSEIYAVATSESSGWRGAALFVEEGDKLIPIGGTSNERATAGIVVSQIGASSSFFFEQNSAIEVELPSSDLSFQDSDMDGLAAGANRLLVGSEVMQYLSAEPLGESRWRLSGLLRGRAGTEDIALVGHPPGTNVTVLDARLTPLDTSIFQTGHHTNIAALGIADPDAVFATLQNSGLSLRPPCPVHPKVSTHGDGSLELTWTRRARGAWRWEDRVDTPLVEERESYQVGFGPVSSPHAIWETDTSSLVLKPTQVAQVITDYGAGNLWVRQLGTHAASPALLLTVLS